MTFTIIILTLTCIFLAFVQIIQAKKISELSGENEIRKNQIDSYSARMNAQGERLSAQNAAIKELTSWNGELSETVGNVQDRQKAILGEMQNIATNLIKTDTRVSEIERYYVTYVARKKGWPEDAADDSERDL